MRISRLQVLASLLFSLSSIHAQANDCTYVCTGLSYGSLRVECLQALSGHSFQRSACEVCKEASYGSDAILCMKEIADKKYSNGEIQVCKGLSYSSQRTECMKAAGRSSYSSEEGGPCSFLKLSRQINGAIGNFEGGNQKAGMNTLYNMRDAIESCAD